MVNCCFLFHIANLVFCDLFLLFLFSSHNYFGLAKIMTDLHK